MAGDSPHTPAAGAATPEAFTQAFGAQPILAALEDDRFCHGCGYNLRGQPARRETMTQVLLVRCPECGAFEPANEPRPWRGRLTRWLTIAYVLGVLAGLGAAMALHAAGLMFVSIFTAGAMGRSFSMGRGSLSAVIVLCLGAAGSAALSALVGTAVMVCAPRSSRWLQMAFVIIWPLPPIGFVTALGVALTMAASSGYTNLLVVPVAGACHAMAAVIGGLVAWLLGLAPARWFVGVILPPRWRGHLSFLWTDSGLPVPAVEPSPTPHDA